MQTYAVVFVSGSGAEIIGSKGNKIKNKITQNCIRLCYATQHLLHLKETPPFSSMHYTHIGCIVVFRAHAIA